MIGRITGTLLEKKPPLLLIEVNGIGYEILCPMTTIYQAPDVSHPMTLHTHFVVREDAQLLFGFHTDTDRKLFRHLIKVNGVGPKLALTILSSQNAEQFIACIQQNDHASLVSIPGIGKKTADRLLIETRDVLAKWHVDNPQSTMPASPSRDALDALVSLGYKESEARKTIQKVNQQNENSDTLIRLALNALSGK